MKGYPVNEAGVGPPEAAEQERGVLDQPRVGQVAGGRRAGGEVGAGG